jgi:hypothetical protein
MRPVCVVVVLGAAGCYDLSGLSRDSGASELAIPDDATPACGALLCETFEGTIDPTWRQSATHGAVSIDPAFGHSPTRSLHATLDAETSPDGGLWAAAYLSEKATFAVPRATVWVRAWIYLPGAPSFGFDLLYLYDTSGASLVELGHSNGKLGLFNDVVPVGHPSTRAAPVQRWFCVEWQVQFGSPGAMAVFLDGAAIPDLAFAENTILGLSVGELRAGALRDYIPNGAPAGEVWIDDVVVSVDRPGCN